MFKRTLVAMVVVLGGCTAAPGGLPNSPWPTKEWAASSPEAEGLDGALLDKLDAEFASGARGQITGMLVIRNGKVVMDKSVRARFRPPVRGPRSGTRALQLLRSGLVPVLSARPSAHDAVGQQERDVGAHRDRDRAR